MLAHFRFKAARVFLFVLEEMIAGFGRDGEAGRDWQPDARHLVQSSALAAEHFAHLAVPLCFFAPEKINVFHRFPISNILSARRHCPQEIISRIT